MTPPRHPAGERVGSEWGALAKVVCDDPRRYVGATRMIGAAMGTTVPQVGAATPGGASDREAIAGLTSAEKYERLAFTFCKLGTTGLIAWVLTPPIFVLIVAAVAIALYGRALALGLTRSKCFLRKPALIIAFWAVVAVADTGWLLVSHFGRG